MSTRLTLAFSVLVLLLVCVEIVTLQSFRRAERFLAVLEHEHLVQAQAVNRLEGAARANEARTLEMVLQPEPARRSEIDRAILANRKMAADMLDLLLDKARDPARQAQVQAIAGLRASYVESFGRVRTLLDEGKVDDARHEATQQTIPRLERTIERIATLERAMSDDTRDRVAQLQAHIRSDQWQLLGVGLLAVTLSVAALVSLRRAILRPLAKASVLVEQVSQGMLGHAVDRSSQHETGQLITGLTTMSQRLGSLVMDVRANASQVAQASDGIASGSQHMQRRAEEQARMLAETTTLVQRSKAAAQRCESSTQQVGSLSRDAAVAAGRGGSAVDLAGHCMQTVHMSAQRIASITGTIDAIAMQTHILALNSAVEAARAGDEGKGFGVVAREVGSLASSSAEAAKEIKQLITTSVDEIDRAHAMVVDAGDTMRGVVSAIGQVSVLMNEIADATAQQGAGVIDMGQAIEHIESMTRKNAALVEESSVAAARLREHSSQLMEAVAVFRWGTENGNGTEAFQARHLRGKPRNDTSADPT